MFALLLVLLLPAAARAETLDGTIDSLDLSAWQSVLEESGAELDAMETVRAIASGEMTLEPETLLQLLRQLFLGGADGFSRQLTAFLGPALLWAVAQSLPGQERIGGAAGYVCFLAGALVMLGALENCMELARTTVRRLGALTGQVFPVLSALMSAAGRPGTADALQPMAMFLGGGMSALVERILTALGGGAAVLAVAGNLTERMRLDGLFRLFVSAGGWLLGAVMTVFLGMTSLGGILGAAKDGATIRAAKYAVDNLLPVVGGDVADAMDAMAASAGLVKSAAGVTGVIVMLSVCLRPVVSIALTMLALRLTAALTEPAADGPLKKCMDQLGQAMGLMLAAVAVSASLFIALTGACLRVG